MGQQLLAWSQYPEPLGKDYYETDLLDLRTLAKLLDLAQVYRATITPAGWRFLWERHGLRGLLDLNERGKWFDPDESLAADQILHRARVAGYEPSAMATA